MKIYQTETKFIEVIETDDSYLYTELMSDDFVCVKFSSEELLSIPQNSYVKIDFYGNERRYYLLTEPEFTKVNSTNYAYTVNFHSGIQILKNCKFVDLRAPLAEYNVFSRQMAFSMFGTPIDFIRLIIENLNLRNQTQYLWTTREEDKLDVPEKMLYFNALNCFEALQYIAEEFNTEWHIYYQAGAAIIKLNRIEENKETPLNLAYGYDGGIKEEIKVAYDENEAFNVLWVRGGDRNINAAEYNNKTLLLPKSQIKDYEGKRYLTDRTGNFVLQQTALTYEVVNKYNGIITEAAVNNDKQQVCVYIDANKPLKEANAQDPSIIHTNFVTKNEELSFFKIQESGVVNFDIKMNLQLKNGFHDIPIGFNSVGLLLYIIESVDSPIAVMGSDIVVNTGENIPFYREDGSLINPIFSRSIRQYGALPPFVAGIHTLNYQFSANLDSAKVYKLYVGRVLYKFLISGWNGTIYIFNDLSTNVVVPYIPQIKTLNLFDRNIPDNYDFEGKKTAELLQLKFTTGAFSGIICPVKYNMIGKMFEVLINNSILSVFNNSELCLSQRYELTGFKIQTPNLVFPTISKEEEIDLSHIYPSHTSTVFDAHKVKEGEKWYWNIYDATIPEDLDYDNLCMNGESVKVVFQDGLLSGIEFEATYEHKNSDGKPLREFRLSNATVDDIEYPNDKFYPKKWDKFIVLDIKMPQHYICNYGNKSGASFIMLEEAIRYFHENHNEKADIKFYIDSVFFRKYYAHISPKIRLGGYININDIKTVEMPIRIKSIKYNITDRFSPTIECYIINKKNSKYNSNYLHDTAAGIVVAEALKKIINNTVTKNKEINVRIDNTENNFINELQNSTFKVNRIIDGDIDGENCRFVVEREMCNKKTQIFLNGVKQKKWEDYFLLPDKKEIFFSFSPYVNSILEIYSN